jgi:hypothetical protein
MDRLLRISVPRKHMAIEWNIGLRILMVTILTGLLFTGGVARAAQGDTTPPTKHSKATNEKQKIRQEMAPVNPTPLGLEPMGSEPDKAPTNSQLQSEGTMDRVLHHLLGGPAASGAYTPPPSEGTTTAGGVPGGNWPGNWWIEGQGGGFNPNTSH